MSDDRLNRRVFKWSNDCSSNRIRNWCFRIKSKFKELNVDQYCDFNIFLSKHVIQDIECYSTDVYKNEWSNKIENNVFSKLRIYKSFKSEFKLNIFKSTMPTRYRSAFAKFRCGVAPLKVETGRHENLPVDKRFCFNCNNVNCMQTYVLNYLNMPLILMLILIASVMMKNLYFFLAKNVFLYCQNLL